MLDVMEHFTTLSYFILRVCKQNNAKIGNSRCSFLTTDVMRENRYRCYPDCQVYSLHSVLTRFQKLFLPALPFGFVALLLDHVTGGDMSALERAPPITFYL